MKLYFKPKEFACPCCGKIKIHELLLIFLNAIRILAKEPVIITSAYRCLKHNKEVGGTPHSAHLKGLAVDIRLKSRNFDKLTNLVVSLAYYCISEGIKFNFGINREKGFIHIDIEDRGYYRIWTYNKDFIRFNLLDLNLIKEVIEISYQITNENSHEWLPYIIKLGEG